jgi:CubicO group peptidase (beta-lactamase class C family)
LRIWKKALTSISIVSDYYSRMRTITATAIVAVACVTLGAQAPDDPWPKTIEEFKSAVQRVLSDTGVPGAGLALVRTAGIEWAGGVGLADRDNHTPVTADTHFRAGSISKTFIASALVQLYLDDLLDLDTPVVEVASEIDIDNAWEPADPVRVIHLLQHTAGFDDLHFNELYDVSGGPELPLEAVLRINPSSRVVRWRPGTRMSYSNPGYTVAAHLIEKVTGEKYEDRIAERIFKPAGMPTSSFYLTKQDEALLAKGYEDRSGPPVPYSRIYLRPSGNLHTSALELGRFVHVLLNWGETATDLVIDPEYLSNMEHPRTTLAAEAGLRNGYGSGIASSFVEGFPMLGHAGGIEGFSSSYAYSTTRDIGFVVLLNGRYSRDAMRRISQLAVRYLKADVEPPPRTAADVPDAVLRSYEGYYHSANPRNQWIAFITWLLDGQSITVEGKRLMATPMFGEQTALVPTSPTMFRFEADPEPSRVFTTDDAGTMVLTGGAFYAERKSRWRVESVRWPVLISAALVVTPLLMLIPWAVHAGRAEPSGFWWVKSWLVGCSVGLILPAIGYLSAAGTDLGTRNVWTASIFIGTILLPAAAILSFVFMIDLWRAGAGRWLRAYAAIVSAAALIVSGYLSAWGMLAFRPWNF